MLFTHTRVNDRVIFTLEVVNKTRGTAGVNIYEWVHTDHNSGNARRGTVEHRYEDGAVVLLAKVAQAAAALQ